MTAPDAREIERRVTENLSLVPWVLQRRFRWAFDYHEFEELMAVGNLGLFEAARRWDPSRTKFSTYCTTYIWGYVMQYLRRVPNWDRDAHRLIPTDSLDAPMGPEGRTLLDSLAALPEELEDPEDPRLGEMRNEFWSVVHDLPLQERNVIVLLVAEQMNMQEAGVVMSLSRQRIRQIYKKAIAHIEADLAV